MPHRDRYLVTVTVEVYGSSTGDAITQVEERLLSARTNREQALSDPIMLIIADGAISAKLKKEDKR